MTDTVSEENQVPGEETEEEKAHDRKIGTARVELYGALAAAHSALVDAQAAHRKLNNGEAWDVEYEGKVTEIQKHLYELLRLTDIVRGLLPTGPNGDHEQEISVVNAAFRASRTVSYLK